MWNREIVHDEVVGEPPEDAGVSALDVLLLYEHFHRVHIFLFELPRRSFAEGDH